MSIVQSDPVLDFSQVAHDRSLDMIAARDGVWVGDVDLNGAEHLNADPHIYDGMRISSRSVRRAAYDHKNKCFLLLAAKSPDILQGRRDEDGTILATEDGLKRGYIISAYRSTLKEGEPFVIPAAIARKMLADWRAYQDKLEHRAHEHFTLYHASVSKQNLSPELREFVNTDTDIEVFTNGRFFYTLDQNKRGTFDVCFYAPTRRKDGGFVAVPLNDKHGFNKVSRYISKNTSYQDARNTIAKHWAEVSSGLWDELNVHFHQGFAFGAKTLMANVVNWPADNKEALIRSALIGFGLGAVHPSYGWGGALTSVAMHLAADESLRLPVRNIIDTLRARSKNSIEQYGFGEDVSDLYKIQTSSHINRLCGKMDVERIDTRHVQLLTREQSNMSASNPTIVHGMRPLDIRGLLISLDQRGFSSMASFADRYTQINAYQNGLMVLKNKLPGERMLFYAWYRPDIVPVPHLDLPDHYQDQIGSGIMRIEYDLDTIPFIRGFKDESFGLSVDDMMQDLERNRLFRSQPGMPETIRQQSRDFIKASFSRDELTYLDYMEELRDWGYMNAQAPVPPDVQSLNFMPESKAA